MRKVFLLGIIAILLTGCVNTYDKETNTDTIFKDEIKTVSEIGDAKGKTLTDEITMEKVEEIFKGIFDLAIFKDSLVEYGEVVEGAGSDGNGGRVFCCKLPANVKFTGTKDSVHEFVEYFEDIDYVISFGDFKVKEVEDELYEVTTVINFLGRATASNLVTTKKEYTIKKNEVAIEEEEEISLREFDLSMVIRPNNSDSSSISLGVISDKDYRVYSDENIKKDIFITFSNEGSKYFAEYSIGDMVSKKVSISPKDEILFDILSCEVINEDDYIGADLYLTNSSNKKVSVAVYDDLDGRVSVANKVGNIEVRN